MEKAVQLWALAAVALTVAPAGCQSGRTSSTELDDFAATADSLVRSLRGDTPREWSLLQVLEHESVTPGPGASVAVAQERGRLRDELERKVRLLWPKWRPPSALVPDLAGLSRWLSSPAQRTRAELEGAVAVLRAIDQAHSEARGKADLGPRPLALAGQPPAPLATPLELPPLPAGLDSAGVNLWALPRAVVALQYARDPETCPFKAVSCLYRQVAWVGWDGRLLDQQVLELRPRPDQAWNLVAGGADGLFAFAIGKDGQAEISILSPGADERRVPVELEYRSRVLSTAEGVTVTRSGSSALAFRTDSSKEPEAAPGWAPTRTDYLARGRGSRDWVEMPDGSQARVVENGPVVTYRVERGGNVSGVRLIDLPVSDGSVAGVPVQLVYAGPRRVVAVALPPNRMVLLLSTDAGETWRGQP